MNHYFTNRGFSPQLYLILLRFFTKHIYKIRIRQWYTCIPIPEYILLCDLYNCGCFAEVAPHVNDLHLACF